MQRSSNTRNGFTLVETLLYVAIFGIMIISLATFSKSLVFNRIQSQRMLEVNDQGASVLKTITQTLRNADQVNSPTEGNTVTSLSVSTISSGTNPTVFSLADGVLNMKEGSGSDIPLTNGQVIVSDLNFTNLSRPGTTNAVKVTFTLASVLDSSYVVVFQGSGGPRK